MATASVFGHAGSALFSGQVAVANPMYVALLNAAFTPALSIQATFADVVANEAFGTGYTAGGQQVTGLSLTYASPNTNIAANDVIWRNSTINANYAVFYERRDTNNPANNPLLVLWDFGGMISSSTSDFVLQISATGVVTLATS